MNGEISKIFIHNTWVFILSLFSISLLSQNLDVEGDARILGKLDLHLDQDKTSIYIGHAVGLDLDTSLLLFNTFIGNSAGKLTLDGDMNVFVGAHSGPFNISGDENTFIGFESGFGNETGGANTFIGKSAGRLNVNGSSNTFVGEDAGYNNDSGFNNTFIGEDAGISNQIGNDNTFVGGSAGYNNATGDYNTCIGVSACNDLDSADYVVAIGFQAGDANSGSGNSYIGALSGMNATTGTGNTYLGTSSGLMTTTASYNTLIGQEALFSSTTGSYNTVIGHESGRQSTTGLRNVMIGHQAGYWNQRGPDNTYIGTFAGYGNQQDTVSECNTYIGTRAGQLASTGIKNVLIGCDTKVIGSILNATAIGADATVDQSHKIRLGNGQITVIEGQVGFSAASDFRLKKEIVETDIGLQFIKELRPVTYKWKSDKNEKIYTGLIAQEVEQTAQELGYDLSAVVTPANKEGKYSLRYAELVVPLINAIQELETRIVELETELSKSKKK